MTIDYNALEQVPINELIMQDSKSDQDTPHSSDIDSVKSEENLSDEEFKNKYTFLDAFKKKRRRSRSRKRPPPEPLIEEKYASD